MTGRPDVIVVGLGAMGAAACWQLARRGLSVLGIDRFHPPHSMGSSHGETRITRTAIGEGDHFVPLVQRTNAIWDELSDRIGQPLVTRCGALIIGPGGTVAAMHGSPDFMGTMVGAARRHAIPHELLTAAETNRRFPTFHPAETDIVYYEPGGGFVRPEPAIAAQLEAATELGATLRLGERVLRVREIPGGVEVETDKALLQGGELLLAAGAWTPGLVAPALPQVSITRQVLHWLPPADPAVWSADRCPVHIWLHGSQPDDGFYGFPLVPGAEANGVKIADENYRIALADPDQLDRTTADSETDALFADHLDGRLSGLGRSALRRAVCLYSSTPDGSFILDRAPGAARITLVSACSGHGFKHSAAVGEAAATFIADGARQPPFGFAPAG